MPAITIKTNDTTNVTRVGAGWLSQGGFYSTSQWYANSGDPAIYNEWRAQSLSPGTPYTIGGFYKFDVSNRSTVSRYAVIDSDGATVLATRYVNMRHVPDAFTYDGVAWRGLFNATPSGTTLYIRLYGDNGGTANYVIADGIFLQPWTDGVPGGVPFSIMDGNWSAANTWAGGVIPGSTTPLTNIYTGVNVDVDTIAGTSGVVGSIAIDIKRETGILTVNDGAELVSRGNIRISEAQTTAGTTDGFWPFRIGQEITGGAKFKFDSSLAADPTNTYYEVIAGGPTQPNARTMILGTVPNPAQVSSAIGGGNGRFAIGAFTAGVGSFYAKNAVLTRIGNASAPAIKLWPSLAGNVLSLENVDFVDCGQAVEMATTMHASGDIFAKNVLTKGTLGSVSIKLASSTPTNGTFLRTVDNLRTDKIAQFSPMTGLTVANIAVPKYTQSAGSLISYSFIGDEVVGPATFEDCYLFVDNNGDTFNAHPLTGCQTVVRTIFDCPRSTQGEMFNNGNNSATETVCQYNIMLPNSSGTGPGVMCVSQTKLSGIRFEHNTFCTTAGASGNAETGGWTIGETMEGMGGVVSNKSNIAYTPPASGGKGLLGSRRNTNVYADSILAINSACNAGNALVTTTSANTKAVYGVQGGYCDTAQVGLTVKTFATAGAFTLKCYHTDGVTFAETSSIAGTATAADISTAVLAALNSLGDGTYAGTTNGATPNSASGTQLTLTRNGAGLSYDRIGAILRPGSANTTGSYLLTSQPWLPNSAGLGSTDQAVPDLAFVDTTRNLATFDRAYLGNTAVAAWADATAYAVGDIRSASDPNAFNGATINYRCISAHTSNAADGTNGKPNTPTTGTAWRARWEYAGAYRLFSTRPVYTPGVPQATPRDLIEWVRAGWWTTTASIANAGHDGATIGAMPYFGGGGGTPSQFHTVTFDAGFSSMTGGYDS